jgi:predicted patatin/cPLA2 family phospholipase
MNIDYLRDVAHEHVPFNVDHALVEAKGKDVHFVATNRSTGLPEYLAPSDQDWVEVVIASCTRPFITKGIHKVQNMDLMDGAWGDPIPIRWAADQGADDILIIRTTHATKRVSKSIPNYLGSLFYRSQKDLSECFKQHHTFFNASLEFIQTPPEKVKIEQLWPEDGLKCTGTSYSVNSIKTDYRYGLQVGIDFVRKSISNN